MTNPMHNHEFWKKWMKEKQSHLSQKNPYIDYEQSKKNPGPIDYETWIKQVVFELNI